MKRSYVASFLILIAVLLMCFCSCSANGNKLDTLEIGGNKFECKMDMSKALELLKDYEYKYYESISCEYNGLDKVYDFKDDGFIFYTYPDGENDYVLEITVSSENIKQLGGKIYNGMPLDDVKSVLGEDYSEEGESICYKVADGLNLSLLISDDKKVIEYTLSAAK